MRKNRRKRSRPGLYEITVSRAMGDALYEKLVDECWEEIMAVFDDPKVRKARKEFLRSIVEAMARKNGGE
jgi:hypothetical protein